MDETGVDVADETRGSVKFHTAISKPVLGTGEKTVLLGPGDGNIEQTTLLFQSSDTVGTHRGGEDVLLQSNNKDSLEFQSLGGMYGHEHNLWFIGITITVKVGHK